MARVGIVGAGLAGLVLARGLAQGHEVTVFEKSRGVGGRLATRYAGNFEFDHGAQFFTARTRDFRDFLAPLIEAGHVLHWPARFVEYSGPEITGSRNWDAAYPHYVGVPRMNAIGKTLARGLDIRNGVRVTRVDRVEDRWRLLLDTGDNVERTEVDWLLVTAPLSQARTLLSANAGLVTAIGDRTMLGCYALMLGFEHRASLPFDAALVREADISWMSVNSSKPGRGPAMTLLVHATNRWAEANMDVPIDDVLAHMVQEVGRITGFDAGAATHKAVQRWRFANSPKATGLTHYLDPERRLGVAGDWWIRGRVESAFTSAQGLLAALDDVV